MKKQNKSILVIGSKGHKGATKCINWGELVYVGDYDYIIINTASLTKELLTKVLLSDTSYFNKLRKDIKDVQENKGIVITCILSPYVFCDRIGYQEKDAYDILRNVVNNYSWSPIIPYLEKIPDGEKIERDKSVLPRKYLDKIKRYSLLYDGCLNNTGYVDRNKGNSFYTKLYIKSLLKNNVGRDVAFSIAWKFHQYSDYTVVANGHLPITFLPATENITRGIDVLITEYGVGDDEAAPDWIAEIDLPGEKDIKDKINDKIQSIKEIDKEIKELGREQAEKEDYKKLLYSQGTELEEIVEKSLALLGLNVEKPNVSNIEDRYYKTSDNQKIYFEIRGVNRLMNENDLSQLIKRIAEKPNSEVYKTRGVFVFNHQNTVRPKDRENAFHHNIETQAKSFNICLIDTKTLFNLVEAKLEGQVKNGFDKKLLNTIGVFK